MNEKEKLLIEEFNKIGVELSDTQVSQFMAYFDMIIEKNKVMNLTAITEFEDVLIKHFVDSLMIVKVPEFVKCFNDKSIDEFDGNDCLNLIDIGTGAGFPGIPIKIVFPSINITLLDSLNKRINFLNEVIDKLNLKNIQTIHGRAEDFGRNPLYREKYDFCVSRAVANLSTLTEYCIPFVRVGGFFISYKSIEGSDEILNAKNALKTLNCNIISTNALKLVDLNGTENNRNLIAIKKKKITPKRYPRKSGTPSKEPL